MLHFTTFYNVSIYVIPTKASNGKYALVFSDAKLQTTRSVFLCDPSEELLQPNI